MLSCCALPAQVSTSEAGPPFTPALTTPVRVAVVSEPSRLALTLSELAALFALATAREAYRLTASQHQGKVCCCSWPPDACSALTAALAATLLW